MGAYANKGSVPVGMETGAKRAGSGPAMIARGAEADVLVAGGGVIGLSCALACRLRGLRVTLLETGVTGGQASGAAAGLLAPFSENGEQPDAFFQLCQASFALFEDWLETLREWTDRDVEFVRSGSLHVALHEADEWPMQVRARWQREAGVRAEWLDAAALRRLEPALGREVAGALFYPDEAHLRAPVYAAALREACERSGVVIVERVAGLSLTEWRDAIVLEAGGNAVEAGGCAAGGEATGADDRAASDAAGGAWRGTGTGRAGGPASGAEGGPAGGKARGSASVAAADGRRWTGDRLLLCTGAWSAAWREALGFPIPVYPIRGQICSFPVPFGEVRHIVFSPQGYAVGKRDGTLVCGASEDVAGFDASVTEAGIGRLVRWSRRLFPLLEGLAPVHAWAGLRPATRDGWPLIGPVGERVFCAFGHYRNGVLLSPVTAAWAADWATGGARQAGGGAAHPADRFGWTERVARTNPADVTAAFDPLRFA